MIFSLPDLLKRHAARTFVIEDGKSRTYQDLLAAIHDQSLSEKPGLFVLESENSYRIFVKVLALLLAGRTFLLAQTYQFSDPEYRRLLSKELGSPLLFCKKESSLTDVESFGVSGPVTGVTPGAGAYFIVRTSGSSGSGFKFILHDSRRFIDKYLAVGPHFSRTFSFSPSESIAGFETLLEVITHGASLVTVQDKFSPQIVAAQLREHAVDYFQTTPSFLNLFLLSGQVKAGAFPDLKKIAYGSEPAVAASLRSLQQRLPEVELVHTYGMSEIGILNTVTSASDPSLFSLNEKFNRGRLTAEGLLQVTSITRMLGYINQSNPETDEWFETRDMAQPEDGFLRVMGREGDLINIAGRKFFPAELESLILQAEGVADVAVVKEAHPLIGTALIAKINLAPGTDKLAFQKSFKVFCETRLPNYMHPQRIVFSEEPLSGARFKKMRSL